MMTMRTTTTPSDPHRVLTIGYDMGELPPIGPRAFEPVTWTAASETCRRTDALLRDARDRRARSFARVNSCRHRRAMKTLTAALAASRTVGDACALKSCALARSSKTVVSPTPSARASRYASSTRARTRFNPSTRSSRARSRGYRSRITRSGRTRWRRWDATARDPYAQRERERRIEDASGVEHMHALAALIAKECGIDDLSAVKGLKELNTLACAEARKRDVGIERVRHFEGESVQNEITKIGIDALKLSRGLRELRLAHNALKTIPACVASTPNLRILDVGHNKISDWGDLSALRDLNRLEQLTLRGCPIADDPEYAEKIARMCPGLKLLDGSTPRDGERSRSR